MPGDRLLMEAAALDGWLYEDGTGVLLLDWRANQFTQPLTGAVSFTGDMLKTTTKLMAGGFTPSGVVNKSTNKLMAGTLNFVGTLLKTFTRLLAGTLSFNGDVQLTDVPPAGGGTNNDGKLTNIVSIAQDGKIT